MNTKNREVFQPSSTPVPQSSRDLTRFIERRRAQRLGYELPLDTREAADYIGFHRKMVERMARTGEIPAHAASGVRRKTRKFYASELYSWLRALTELRMCARRVGGGL